MARRTDLAVEARELWQEQAGQTTELAGVRARESKSRGITTTVVEILDRRGVRALQKPEGTYVTMELEHGLLRDQAGFARAAGKLGKQLAAMVPQSGPVLVVGLGNRAVTPDALGPQMLDHLLVTGHLCGRFPQFRSVSAIAPGVLGVTGLESVEVVRGIVERTKPVCVVAVDALASREPARICTAIQLADTGIIPGSGVHNSRAAFDRQTLGVPVVAVGVPTVVDAVTLAEDLMEKRGGRQVDFGPLSLVVTPKDIDAQIQRVSRLLGYGISMGLHRGMRMEEIACLIC